MIFIFKLLLKYQNSKVLNPRNFKYIQKDQIYLFKYDLVMAFNGFIDACGSSFIGEGTLLFVDQYFGGPNLLLSLVADLRYLNEALRLNKLT